MKEKLQRKRDNFKEFWRTLNSLGMASKGRRQSKTLKENGAVSFNSKDNANTLVHSLLQKLPPLKNKFGVETTEEYYKQIRSEYQDFVLHNVNVTTVDKILKNLDVATTSRIDQISAKSLKDGAPAIAIHYKPVNKT